MCMVLICIQCVDVEWGGGRLRTSGVTPLAIIRTDTGCIAPSAIAANRFSVGVHANSTMYGESARTGTLPLADIATGNFLPTTNAGNASPSTTAIPFTPGSVAKPFAVYRMIQGRPMKHDVDENGGESDTTHTMTVSRDTLLMAFVTDSSNSCLPERITHGRHNHTLGDLQYDVKEECARESA
jgi:hypothetical protein